MIDARVGTSFAAESDHATPGLVGSMTVEVYNPSDGTAIIAPTTVGITEPSSGKYRVVLTVSVAGRFKVRWSGGGRYAEEDLFVSATHTVSGTAGAFSTVSGEVAGFAIATRGRDQRALTSKGKARSRAVLISGTNAPAYDVEDVDIRIIALYGRTSRIVASVVDTNRSVFESIEERIGAQLGADQYTDITPLVTSLTYGVDPQDSGNMVVPVGRVGLNAVSGTLVVRRTDPLDAKSSALGIEDRVAIEVFHGGKWKTDVVLAAATAGVDLPSGEVSYELNDPFSTVDRIYDEFLYRKSKSKPQGWLCDEIVRDACVSHGVPVGELMRGRYRIKHLKGSNLLRLCRRAYDIESNHTGRVATARFQGGRMEFIPQTRSRVAYKVGPGARDAHVDVGIGMSALVTVLDAHGVIGKGKGRTKIRTTVLDADAVGRFGHISERFPPTGEDPPRVTNEAELVDRAKRELAARLRLRRVAQVTMPYLPFVRLLDPVVCDGGFEDDFGGLGRLAFVQSVMHTIDGSSRTTALSLIEQDDRKTYAKEKKKKTYDAKRKKRGSS